MTAALREEVQRRGGKTLDGEAFDHPYMDSLRIHEQRMEIIKAFLMPSASKSDNR